ncbi:hypothetical protein CPB84DRAFT_1491771 [Gymnopilus junonius]|uniref:Uncharacterized protein n=1 Tax=Gymnopilus junonius TaxID=109634 RepID=A0A9P5NFG5_GYMJU|nr:hypothetical protein CPB84DRAFT_1491771 [Gymnopilus junonius]
MRCGGVTLTAVKRDLVKLGAPVVKRVIRDGAWIIIFLCSTFTAMISYSWILQIMQGHIVFGWPNTILSIACCRIIMNMETLNYADSEPEPDPTVGFNSFDSLQLGRLEQERREREGLETESRPCA